MKHPKLSTLQDYFENELNSVQVTLVKEHLLDCNECTFMLSQMAKVDTRFKTINKMLVSDELKNRIFSDAKKILEEKREKIQTSENHVRVREEWLQHYGELFQSAVSELKVPAFQLASVTILIGYIVASNQVDQTIVKKPLAEDIVVFTSENASSTEGDGK